MASNRHGDNDKNNKAVLPSFYSMILAIMIIIIILIIIATTILIPQIISMLIAEINMSEKEFEQV